VQRDTARRGWPRPGSLVQDQQSWLLQICPGEVSAPLSLNQSLSPERNSRFGSQVKQPLTHSDSSWHVHTLKTHLR